MNLLNIISSLILAFLTIASTILAIITYVKKKENYKIIILSLIIIVSFLTTIILNFPIIKNELVRFNILKNKETSNTEINQDNTIKENNNSLTDTTSLVYDDNPNDILKDKSYNDKIKYSFDIAKSIPDYSLRSNKLDELVKYSLNNNDADFSILIANAIPLYENRSISYGLIIDYLLKKNEPNNAIAVAKKIPLYDYRTTNLKKIIDFCLKFNLFEQARLASDLFPYYSDEAEYKAKIIDKIKK
jgi:hypothetical protein